MKAMLLRAWEQLRRWCNGCLMRVRFLGRAVKIHPSARVSWRSVIRTRGGGSVSIGGHCEIHPFAMIMTYGGDISMGEHCSLNPFSIIYGHGGVRIGDGVRIAAHTVIIPANHNLPKEGMSLREGGLSARGITIADEVWIGAGARILDGVTLGSYAVVGAGSVVTKPVPARATVAGVPARIIRQSQPVGSEQ